MAKVPSTRENDNRLSVLETNDFNNNLIINGNFDIWQRGTSFPSAGGAVFNADRFQYSKSGTMVHDISQSTDVPTQAESSFQSAYSLLVDCTTIDSSIAAGDFASHEYRIEGQNAVQIYGKTFTLSFWVKATKTGIYCVGFRNNSANRSYVSEYTVNASDVWEKKTITVTHDLTGTWATDNSIGMRINWGLAVGSTYQTTADSWQTGNFFATANQVNACDSTANNFRIAQVQINEGASATNFRRAGNNISEELAMCQRYYEVLNIPTVSLAAQYTGTAYFSIPIMFERTKRITPTCTYGDLGGSYYWVIVGVVATSANTLSSFSFINISNQSCAVLQTRTAGGTAPSSASMYIWEPAFNLIIDAEL